MVVYAPGTQEKDPQKQNMALQEHARQIDLSSASIATNTTNITALQTVATNLAAPITNSLGADVTLGDNAFHDGPSCAQGTSGTWFASGTVTVLDTGGVATIVTKLWDGTTIIASTIGITTGTNLSLSVSLSGVITNPAGNIRISCQDSNGSPAGKIKFSSSTLSKDSTLTVIRLG